MPHIKLRFSSQSGHPDLLYSQEWVNVIFLHLWPQKLYRAFRFGTLWPVSCSYPRHSQLTRHSLMLANGRIRQSLIALVAYWIGLQGRLAHGDFGYYIYEHVLNFCPPVILQVLSLMYMWNLKYGCPGNHKTRPSASAMLTGHDLVRFL